MGYTKLFASILLSTVWREPDHVRLTWISLMALADEHGEVRSSVPGLADVTRVTRAQVDEALEKLQSPDPDSTNPAHEGRRIERIDGGWRLLNHNYYKKLMSIEDRRAKDAERQRRHRSRSVTLVTEVTTPDQTRSDQTKEEIPPSPLPVVLREIPELWEPSAELVTRAVMDGCPEDVFRAKLGELRQGPIGGARGILPAKLDAYILTQARKWKTWAETERAKARGGTQQPRGEAIAVRDDRGSLLVLEPSQAHRAYAAKHGLDLAHIMNHIRDKRFVETLGLERARECIKELLVQAARKKGKPNERPTTDRRPDPSPDRRGPQPRQTRAPGGG